MTKREREEFVQYLKQCPDRQVRGVHEKEERAGREDYAALAHAEWIARDLDDSSYF